MLKAFNNGRMNHRIWSGLTVSLLSAVFGAATSTYAQQITPVGQGSEGSTPATEVRRLPAAATLVSGEPQVRQTEVVKVGEVKSQTGAAVEEEVVAKIQAYELTGRQAATLYVRNIPVLTFLGSGPVTGSGTKVGETTDSQKSDSRHQASGNTASSTRQLTALNANDVGNDPVWRATAVAAKLNQLSRENVDARAIAVRWKAECNCYSIQVQNEELVRINEKTTLPDTTQNLAQDALQATNRLRRLMGNAPPLQEIAGMPPARPVVRVAVGPIRFQMTGIASWYGPGFHGNRSASGERYNQNAMTAAHRSLPFGTKVQVTNLRNGRSVVVRINDRGPFIRGRVIDLSAAAARVLGLMQSGTAPVQIDVLDNPKTVAIEN